MKRYSRGCKLVVCLRDENRVVIHDRGNKTRKEPTIIGVWKCDCSSQYIVAATVDAGLHMFTIHGDFVRIVPESENTCSVSIHPCNNWVLAWKQ